jgi:hypothetical protein
VQRAIAGALLPLEPVQVAPIQAPDLPALGLDYDGVSALVLRDPGASLAPAQVDSLVSWLAGGGRLVLTGARKGGDSLLARIAARAAPLALIPEREKDGLARLVSGLGAALALPDEAADMPEAGSPERWRSLLGLALYAGSFRLSASRAFPDSDYSWAKRDEAAAAEKAVNAALLAWGLAALVMAMSRRERVFPLALFAAASLILAIWGGIAADRERHRGATALARAVLLPGGSSLFAYAGIQASIADPEEDWTAIAAPRSLRVELAGTEGGLYSPQDGAETLWRHAIGRPLFSIRSAGARELELAALLPGELLQGSLIPGLAADCMAAEGAELPPRLSIQRKRDIAYIGPGADPTWWSPASGAAYGSASGAWKKEKFPPSWLAGDSDWIVRMRTGLPGQGFLVGRDRLPGFRLVVHGGAVRELCWAIPVLAQDGPRTGRE